MTTYDIVETIKKYMYKRGITQNELASRLGITQANVSSTLSGKRDIRLNTLITYCDAIGLEIKIFEKV